MNFADRYKKLNVNQKRAVDTIEGPLMVVAGPGTGKTELLSMRAANILQQTDTLPSNILCLTFTESGATAMRERLAKIIGADAYKVAIHTFHSFGSEIINQNAEYFYQGASFRPADDLSSYELLTEIFESLDHDNPLSSKLNGEYTHLGDTLTAISELKKSGLTSDELLTVLDANDVALEAAEPQLASVFSTRISKTTLALLPPVAAQLAKLPKPSLPPNIAPLGNVIALSLAHAVDEATDTDSTKPITAWKNTYLEKNDAGEFVFKDRKRSKKLRALSYIYYKYLLNMQEAELYDFDDMVLRVVHAMEVFADLRYNLQEKYLYIMVDEFQDTNLAQARILHNLTVNEQGDAPNIMVVGDDDQAIYSFQGAEISNILSFRDIHQGLPVITLTDNYRSADPILIKARQVITLGTERLEHYVEEIDKTLTAHHTYGEAEVSLNEFDQLEDERTALVKSIAAKIEHGSPAGTIAVLSRRHHELINLLPYFQAAKIAVNYERRDNVLDSEVVLQIVSVARIADLISANKLDEANALLPKLLAHPAWGLETSDIWKLSLAAYKNRSGWLEEMAVQPVFTVIHGWLIELARQSLFQPAEHLIDTITGAPHREAIPGFTSPLYQYFFSDEHRITNPEKYLLYLEALRTIRAKLREHRPDIDLKLKDFIEFIDLHIQANTAISSVRARNEAQSEAVNLMTAHKSKGQEFDHVYIVGAVDSAWGERVRSRSRLISYPENLPLQPSGDSFDDRLRLFFVAMTRARNTLNISYSVSNENDKTMLPASFLVGEHWSPKRALAITSTPKIERQLLNEWYTPLVSLPTKTMQELLAPTLAKYKLSATHLNSFLDITRGGPTSFLINNLLRFPQAMSPNAAFGSAVHRTIQKAHAHLTATSNLMPEEDVLHEFENALKEHRLAEADYAFFSRRGTSALRAFLSEHHSSFTISQKPELSFANQHSRVGDATLTGSLDLVDINQAEKTITVTDYKTGKPNKNWKAAGDFEKIKLHKYKQQLIFYKLLVENSRDYQTYNVDQGVLQFVEPAIDGSIYALTLEFDAEEVARLSRLVQAVYKSIITLNLPNTDNYPQTYTGVLAFENDLINQIVD